MTTQGPATSPSFDPRQESGTETSGLGALSLRLCHGSVDAVAAFIRADRRQPVVPGSGATRERDLWVRGGVHPPRRGDAWSSASRGGHPDPRASSIVQICLKAAGAPLPTSAHKPWRRTPETASGSLRKPPLTCSFTVERGQDLNPRPLDVIRGLSRTTSTLGFRSLGKPRVVEEVPHRTPSTVSERFGTVA